MNGRVRDDIVTDTSCFFRPDLLSADATQVYTTLLLMSVLHIKIKKAWVMRIGPAGTLSLTFLYLYSISPSLNLTNLRRHKIRVRLDQQPLPPHFTRWS